MARERGQQIGYLHLKGNTWVLTYREDVEDEHGNIERVRRHQRLGTKKEVGSKREAQRLAREILNEVDGHALQPSSLQTVEHFIDTRFNPDIMWTLKYAGKKHYTYVFERFIVPAIGKLRLRDVTNDHAQALVKDVIENQGKSLKTAKHVRAAISALFNHAKLKRCYTGDNPARGVRFPDPEEVKTKAKPRHALTPEQARAVWPLLPRVVQGMVLLSIETSMNAAELLGLKWRRVNLTDSPVLLDGEPVILPRFSLAVRENFYRGYPGSVKRPARRRNVPLTEIAIKILQEIRDQSKFTGPEDPVFASRKGTPLNECNLRKRVLKPAGAEIGCPWLSWTVFRRTSTTLAELAGMPLADRQAQMGHSDVRMTLWYTITDVERRRQGVQTVTSLLGVN
jgi:integrase